jgi:hypothetical protein
VKYISWGYSDSTPNQGLVKFYPLGPDSENPDFKLVEQVHILTSQGHPEFDEANVTEITRNVLGNKPFLKIQLKTILVRKVPQATLNLWLKKELEIDGDPIMVVSL